MKFESGFEGDRETFFQIHSASGDCNSRPVLMMKWDYGYFSLWAMSKKLLGSEYFNQFHDFVGNHLDRWIPIEIAIKGTKFLFVKFDGRVLLENYDFYYSESCGATKVKFGIYRPGQQDGSNNTSVASFKEIRIGSLENQK